jgi:hypothetical protein
MPTVSRPAIASIALFGALLGASHCLLPPNAASAKPARAKRAGAQRAPRGDAPVVRLLDAGQAPRRLLRYAPAAGSKQTARMKVEMTLEMEAAGAKQPAVTMPAIQVTMDVGVDSVSPNGDIHAKLRVSAFDIAKDDPSGMGDVVRQTLKGLVGTKGELKLTSRGFVKLGRMRAPPGADPSVRQSIDQMEESLNKMISALPEEAVGAGARWEVLTRGRQNGIVTKQTITCEVVRLTGSSVDLSLRLAQSADPQKVAPPGLPAGTELQLVSLESHGEGTTTTDLSRLMPTRSSLGVTVSTRMKVGDQTEKQEMGMKAQLKVGMEGGP